MEIAIAMKAMAKAKVVGPDGLPVELLKLQLQKDRAILLELHRLATLIWREGKISQQLLLLLLLLLFLTFSVLGSPAAYPTTHPPHCSFGEKIKK